MTTAELVSVAGIIAGAALLVAAERVRPYNRGQELFREGFFDDFVLYTLVQSYVLSIIIFSGLIRWIDGATGLSRLELIGDWPIWLQLLFFTLTHDLYIYWMHRWQHQNRFLWRLHEAHHSPKKVDWLSGSRSHALEILVNQTIEFAPIVLLGAAPEVVAYKGLVSAVWGMFIHANVDVRLGPLRYVINGPEMHRWHHSTGKGRNRNFSTKFAFWDWIFGTAYAPPGSAEEYGLRTRFPAHYFAQQAFAFRRFGPARRSQRSAATEEAPAAPR